MYVIKIEETHPYPHAVHRMPHAACRGAKGSGGTALAAGLALAGKKPFAATYAVFSPGRSWEQVRANVCINGANVKLVGSHAGITVGPDGATA